MRNTGIVALQRFLLGLPLSMLLIGWLGLWAGLPIRAWQFPLATVIALLFGTASVKDSRHRLTATIICLATLALALWISCSLYEISADGRTYHSPPAYAMSNGWNPIYEPSLCRWEKVFCKDLAVVYMDHYPKAQWIIAAAMYSSLGYIEAGNAMNLLMLLAALLYCNQVLGNLPGLSAGWRRTLAFVIAINPVTIAQVYTSYVDGLVASLLTIYVLSLTQYLIKPRFESLLPALLVLPYLINLKFSALAYGAFLGVCFALAFLVIHRQLPVTMIAGGLGLCAVSIMLLGYNPYVQNIQQDKHFFYPVYLNDGRKSNTVDRQADAQFIAQNRVSKFFIANYSRNKKEEDGWTPEFSMPLTWLKPQRSADPRFSGFGPLFGLVLGFSIIQLFFIRNRYFLIPIFALIGSIFLTDAGWWPRLAPQAWLVVCLIQAAHLAKSSKSWAGLSRTMVILLAVNGLIVLSLLTSKYWENAQEINQDIATAKNTGTPIMLRNDEMHYFNTHKIRDIGTGLVLVNTCTEARSNALFITCSQGTAP